MRLIMVNDGIIVQGSFLSQFAPFYHTEIRLSLAWQYNYGASKSGTSGNRTWDTQIFSLRLYQLS